MAHSSTIILIGASTRAAATSARRARLAPWCVDLYADADLRRIATVRQVPVNGYPRGLFEALADAPDAPVIYTGALENHPRLVARIDRPLWGNSPDILRAVRSPVRWTACLREHGVPCPAVAETQIAEGDWLLKPRRSAGGTAIQPYGGQAFSRRTHFIQERIEGIPASAVFLGRDDGATLLGVTQQLVGVPWLHANGFRYAGNVGPLRLDEAAAKRWRDLGAVLVTGFRLRGLFGIDAILRDGVPWPVEINPRYTASVEVLERGFGTALLSGHCETFAPTPEFRLALGLRNPSAKPQAAAWAKGILYARKTLVFPESGPWLAALEPGVDLDTTEYADFPRAGEVIERGRPVLTLFASAPSVADCLAELQEKAQALDRCLWG